LQKEFVCDNNTASNKMGMFMVVLMVLSSLDEKFVLLLDEKRKLAWKLAILIQILISVTIIQISIAYIDK
jgi:hypothetical protein